VSGLEEEEYQLPSMTSSSKFLQGDASQMLPMAALTAVRALEIAAGLYVSGNWGSRGWKNSVGAAVAGQLFILAYSALHGADLEKRLPSTNSATGFLKGEPNAVFHLVKHLLGRSAIFGLGMYVMGERNNLVKQAIMAGLTVELVVLAMTLQHLQKQET
jgi:hypothetical protein